jgi:hypothetical protein
MRCLSIEIPCKCPDANKGYFFERPTFFVRIAVIVVPSGTRSAGVAELERLGPMLSLSPPILEVFWCYWNRKYDQRVRRNLIQEIVTLLRKAVLATSTATRRFSFDEIGAAVRQAESTRELSARPSRKGSP